MRKHLRYEQLTWKQPIHKIRVCKCFKSDRGNEAELYILYYGGLLSRCGQRNHGPWPNIGRFLLVKTQSLKHNRSCHAVADSLMGSIHPGELMIS